MGDGEGGRKAWGGVWGAEIWRCARINHLAHGYHSLTTLSSRSPIPLRANVHMLVATRWYKYMGPLWHVVSPRRPFSPITDTAAHDKLLTVVGDLRLAGYRCGV